MTHEQLMEKVARAVYEHWNFYPADAGKDCTPWVSGGNSYRQEQARDYARAALAVVYEAMREPDEETLGPGIYSAADVMLASQWVNGPDASVVLALAQCAFSAGYTATIAASPLNPEVK